MWHELWHSLRSTARRPTLSICVILLLGIGVGFNSTLFSLLHGVILRPLDFPSSEQLVLTFLSDHRADDWRLSAGALFEIRKNTACFRQVTAFVNDGVIAESNHSLESLSCLNVEANFFDVLGQREPGRGRGFSEAATNEILISDSVWKNTFGASPDVIGTSVTLDGQPHQIVGVLSENWTAPVGIPQVLKLADFATRVQQHGGGDLFVLGRLLPDVSMQRARDELNMVMDSLAASFPRAYRNTEFNVVSLHDYVVGDQAWNLMLVLQAAAFLILLICCANTANLVFLRFCQQYNSLVIRRALGATPGRILVHLLFQVLILSLAGVGLGLLLGHWGLEFVEKTELINVPRQDEVKLDGTVYLVTVPAFMLVSFLTSIPIVVSTLRITTADVLGSAPSRASSNSGSTLTLKSLIGIQAACCVLLLIGSGLLLQTLFNYFHQNLGFKPERLLTSQVSIPSYRLSSAPASAVAITWEQLLRNVKSQQGVQSASISLFLPLREGGITTAFRLEGQTEEMMQTQYVDIDAASPEYFATFSIPILEGRAFTAQDRGGSPAVAIVNESFKKACLGENTPLDRQVWVNDGWKTIIGVCGDVRNRGLERTASPAIYFPFFQYPQPWANLTVRTMLAPAVFSEQLKGVVREQRLGIRAEDAVQVEQVHRDMFSSARRSTALVSLFATLSLVLAAVGIFSVTAFSVSQRQKEVGIRMACGATVFHIIRRVLRDALVMVLLGVVAGVAGGLLLSQFIQHLLFQVKPINIVAFGGSAAVMVVLTLLASALPAYRAAHIDPARTLREE